MGRIRFLLLFLLGCSTVFGQTFQVLNHQSNRKKAIVKNDTFISDYVYTEVSTFSENKAYVAKGDLYAYIDDDGKELCPYIFAEANDFENGYAVVGDSFGRGMINAKMHVILPFDFHQVLLPNKGLIMVQNKEGRWGAYDTLGKLKLPLIYDLPPNVLTLERIIVRKFEEYGVVNDCDEIVFNCSYQYISPEGFGYRSGTYLRLFKP